jgi:putative serine protease PepD
MSDENQTPGDNDETTHLPVPDERPADQAPQAPQAMAPTTGPTTEPTAVIPPAYPPGQTFPFRDDDTNDAYPPVPPAPYGEAAAAPAGTVTATKPRGKARTAGVLVAALLLGGAGGVAGAAAFTANQDDTADTNTTGVTSSTVSHTADTPAPSGTPQAVAEEVLPSVVKINVSGDSGQGSGSGIILSSDGEILTNNHVVEVLGSNGKMSVAFNDGTVVAATVVGADPVTDLAVIKAEGVSDLTPATLGDSDNLDVGEGVVAIGSPFGLQATVTSGIVSALNRPVSVGTSNDGTDTTYPAIQTDAAINPGNSGGPLMNLAGEVVGINSSIRTSSSGATGDEGGSIGLGFAIPITKVLPVVDQLRQGETPTHARLGVTVSNASQGTDLITGASIQEVTSGSAGDEAGLKSGDIVTRVDDQAITSLEGLVATIRGYRPGDKVTLTIMRDGESQTLTATLDSDLATNAS